VILVRRGFSKLVLLFTLLLSAVTWNGLLAKEVNGAVPVPFIALSALPAQGFETYRLIHQGGPFPYEKDGVIFGNRERLLPMHTRGYYREYTVKTPGARNRGARRIVCGGSVRTPDTCYYTADHYASYSKIVP
jgi:ribonuclease T1